MKDRTVWSSSMSRRREKDTMSIYFTKIFPILNVFKDIKMLKKQADWWKNDFYFSSIFCGNFNKEKEGIYHWLISSDNNFFGELVGGEWNGGNVCSFNWYIDRLLFILRLRFHNDFLDPVDNLERKKSRNSDRYLYTFIYF